MISQSPKNIQVSSKGPFSAQLKAESPPHPTPTKQEQVETHMQIEQQNPPTQSLDLKETQLSFPAKDTKAQSKGPLTMDQVKQFITDLISKYGARPAYCRIIAAYDYLKLWNLESRKQRKHVNMKSEYIQTDNIEKQDTKKSKKKQGNQEPEKEKKKQVDQFEEMRLPIYATQIKQEEKKIEIEEPIKKKSQPKKGGKKFKKSDSVQPHQLTQSIVTPYPAFQSMPPPQVTSSSVTQMHLQSLISGPLNNSKISAQGQKKSEKKAKKVIKKKNQNEPSHLTTQPQENDQDKPRKGRGRPPKNGVRPLFLPEDVPKPEDFQARQLKQSKLAQIFTIRGYGIGFAKTEVDFTLDTCSYATIMRSVLFKGFLKLQQIIGNVCGLQTVQNQQHRSIRFKNELCRCEKWMQRRQLKTFNEYIRSVYDLDPRAVSKGDTIALYRVIVAHWQVHGKKTPVKEDYQQHPELYENDNQQGYNPNG